MSLNKAIEDFQDAWRNIHDEGGVDRYTRTKKHLLDTCANYTVNTGEYVKQYDILIGVSPRQGIIVLRNLEGAIGHVSLDEAKGVLSRACGDHGA